MVQKKILGLTFTLLFLTAPSLFARSTQNISISYGNSDWNKDPSKIDSAYLYIRDKKTKKIIKVILDEKEPDSSIFAGRFTLNLNQNESIDPEIFIPPKGFDNSNKSSERFHTLVLNNKLPSKPYLYKRPKGESQSIDVFDTKEQAVEALSVYKEEQKLKAARNSLVKPVPQKEDLQAEKVVEQQALLDKLKAEALQREQERLRIKQLEAKRIEELKKKQMEEDQRKRQEKQKKAKLLSEKAIQEYQKGDYKKAEELFKQSIELDPNNDSYYFQYAVTLYRNEKFNEALVIFKIIEDEEQYKAEKPYYMGLTHYRLNELDAALAQFQEVKKHNHEVLSPAASFYEGLILFNQEKYEEAKAPFEFVLDNSKNPKLDEKAESYLDKIAGLMIFKKKQSKKNDLSGGLGLVYDSNILLSPDGTDQGSSTNIAGARLSFNTTYERRFIFKKEKTFSAKGTFFNYYSFKSDASQADPYLANISLPYSYTTKIWGKGYKLTLSPGYETLYLDADNNGQAENIQNSILLSLSHLFIMDANWFSTYYLDIRQDDSLTSDTGDNIADATKITLKTDQSFFKDKAKKRAIVGSFGYTLNNAKGKNKAYNRFDLGGTYIAPFEKWDLSWSTSLAYYQAMYKSTNNRTDKNITFTFSVSKPIYEWLTSVTALSYIDNTSNVSTSDYSKYTLSSSLNATYSF